LNSNHLQTIFGKKFWLVCIAVGISLFGVVFALSRRADIQNCEQRLTGVMEFIKAQSADYTKYNDTAVAKSLVREAAAVHALEGLSLGCDEAALLEYARTLWLTGVSVLNAQGELVCEYTENGTGYAQLQSGIKMEPILSVIDYPQKTYVKRVELGGGNFVNVAVHSCADGTGVVLAYRYIPAEFSQKSVLSIQTLLDGYEISSTGTLLVAEDNRVAASNNPTLIGTNIFENERLMSIRRSGHADKLIRVYAPKGIEQCYGMYSHGQDYYLYAYVPARQVYTLTVMNLVITLVMYILILALVQVFRWNSAKDFFMQQEHSEQEYRKSLEQKNVALQLAVQRETKANLAKREFLFNMSHDIRTPMNAIIGFTALAQTHIDDRGQVEDYLKKISVSSQHLLSLINDVLDMSRIESGKVTLEAKPVHLPELVHELRDIVQAVVSEKDLSLTLDTVGVENEDVIADPLRLEQILINVLANAVKFTPDGGQISLWIVQKDTAPAGYADFEFHIKDNGIGMSEEFQKHIFEQFARERTSTVSKIQGTGLGMAITKSLVDMMGGRITVKSEQGKGSEFTISLRFPIGEAKTELRFCREEASGGRG
jgi:signal transduction histidine kinase